MDDDDRCGPHQVIWGDDELCVCAEGSAYTPTGCVPCGENEVGTAAGCACTTGYARASANEPCVQCGEHESASPSGCTCDMGFFRSGPGEPCLELELGGAGTECVTDTDCMNPDYPHCELRASGAGYCTSLGCATNEDCVEGFSCVTSASPTACRLPPTGVGQPCARAEDCAANEASFCDTAVSFTCLVQNCSLDPDDCFPGTECCDVGFGLILCIPTGACQS